MAKRGKSQRLPEGTWLWATIVFFLALLLRLIFLIEFSHVPLFDTPVMDPTYHHEWAQHIASGQSFVEGPFFRAPLYPYLLGAVYFIFGDGPWAPRILQILLGSLSALLTFFIALRVFNLKTARVAGVIVAMAGTLIFYDGQLLIPTLAIWLDLFGVYLLLEGLDRKQWWWYALSGLITGLSAIARPTILLFAVVAVFWLLLRRQKLLKSVAIYILALIIPMIPVTIYNWAVSGQFVPIATYGGLNFYIGNNLTSDGATAKIPGARQDWWGMMEDSEKIADEESGEKLNEFEQSSFWLNKTFDEIIDNPGHFIGLLGRKFLLLINGQELSNNFDLYFFAHQTTILRLLMWHALVYFPWGLVMPLAVCGLVLAPLWKRNILLLFLFICSYVLAVVLFFVTARYRLPLFPILAIFAGYALTQCWSVLRRKGLGGITTPLVILLVMLVVCNVDFLGYSGSSEAQGLHALASVYVKRGDDATAARYYRQALAADPTLTQASNDLAVLYLRHGETDQAIRLLKRAVTLAPGNVLIRLNLADCYNREGYPDSARAQLRIVLRKDPKSVEALNALALNYASAGLPDSARAYFQKLIDVSEPSANDYYNVGLTFAEQQNVDSAIVYYQHANKIDSSFAGAYFNLGYLLLGKADTLGAIRAFRSFMRHWRGDESKARQVDDILGKLTGTD
jgi:tetratricopeptide (TPR) repeat protein